MGVVVGVVVGGVVVGVAIVVVVGSLLGGVDGVMGAVGLDGLMTEAVASMGDGFAAIFACIVADIVLNTSFKAFLVDRAVDQNCGVQTREKTRMQTAIIFKGPINGPSKSGDVVGGFFFFRPIFSVDGSTRGGDVATRKKVFEATHHAKRPRFIRPPHSTNLQ